MLPKEVISPDTSLDPTQLITNELNRLENESLISFLAMKIEYSCVLLSTMRGSTVLSYQGSILGDS